MSRLGLSFFALPAASILFVGLVSLVSLVSACTADDDDGARSTADAGHAAPDATTPPLGTLDGSPGAGDAATPDAAPADAALTDASDAATDAAPSTDAASDGGPSDAADAADAAVVGRAIFTTGHTGSPDGPPVDTFSIAYAAVTPAALSTTCTTAAAGASCSLQVCLGAAPAPTYTAVDRSAGTITITNTASGAMRALSPGTTGYSDKQGAAFSTVGAGDLTLVAAGDPHDLPAFSLAIPLPGAARATLPSLTITPPPPGATGAPGSTSFSRAADLPLTWTGGVSGATLVAVFATSSIAPMVGPTRTLTCTFDQSAASGTIPSAGGLASLDRADGIAVRGAIAFTARSAGSTTDGAVPFTASIEMPADPYDLTFTTTD